MATLMVEKRNVIVLGKTGAGKSSVANQILGIKRFDVAESYGSQTNKVQDAVAKIPDSTRNVDYMFKLIDTVGFFDTKLKSNDKNLKEIKEYFQTRLPKGEGVNLVLFIFRQGRFTPEEKSTFDFIIKNFDKEIRDISALVITNCENYNDEGREEQIKEFKNNTITSPTAGFMQKGIYAVGFPDTSQMVDVVKEAIEKRKEVDAKTLRDIVMYSNEMHLSEDIFKTSFWDKVSQCNIL